MTRERAANTLAACMQHAAAETFGFQLKLLLNLVCIGCRQQTWLCSQQNSKLTATHTLLGRLYFYMV